MGKQVVTKNPFVLKHRYSIGKNRLPLNIILIRLLLVPAEPGLSLCADAARSLVNELYPDRQRIFTSK